MTPTEIIELELNRLERPDEVLTLRVASGQDATGDDALWIWLVVRPGATMDQVVLDRLLQFKRHVREKVTALEPGVWPYVRIENPGDSGPEAAAQ